MGFRNPMSSVSIGLIGLISMMCAPVCRSFAQSETSQQIQEKLLIIENETLPDKAQKLRKLDALKKEFDNNRLAHDSVYARILDRTALYQYRLNNNIATPEVIANSIAAIRINTGNEKSGSRGFAINSLLNLAYYYKSLNLVDKALTYFDSTILLTKVIAGHEDKGMESRYQKCLIFFTKGDYQKSVDENTIGITEAKKANDSGYIAKFFNQRAQSYLYQQKYVQASSDVDTAMFYADSQHDSFEKATALTLRAMLYDASGDTQQTILFFKQAIRLRISTQNNWQVADDYTDFGNFFLRHNDYHRANECYVKTIDFAMKNNDAERLSKAHVNLEQLNFQQGKYEKATDYYFMALNDFNIDVHHNVLINPPVSALEVLPNKEWILVILGNKTELLLHLYKKNNDPKFLQATLETAKVADSLITKVRHEQMEEQSKLYWRDWTREFFTNAMEACYLANDFGLAFFFMEKSRAVLLNDKLNEAGASAHLPPAEISAGQRFQLAIISAQLELNAIPANTPAYNDQQLKLLQVKEEFDRYIKSLEQKYPVYYQYKYADDIVSLADLKKYLVVNNQCFVHYFVNDTLAYVLGISPSATKMIKLSGGEFNYGMINQFLGFCEDEGKLNRKYQQFVSLSEKLYKALFQPLGLPKGRVIICPDNFLLPFEALCTDQSGRQFLLSDYTFSYVYSARYLLKKTDLYAASGNFVGFAPVSFQPYLNLAELKSSESALRQTASNYQGSKLFINEEASKKNFLEKMPGYAIVTIFSHANADTSGNEPLLFMQDSVIHLSELQLLNQPVTRLVLLSACQTNVGKIETGEGIYSLSRGFAAAGVPSVAATLWEAEDQSIYTITQIFNENLAKGVRKDEALRKAKLDFIRKGSRKNLLPYYWANLVLVGNTDPVSLSGETIAQGKPISSLFLDIGISLLILLCVFLLWYIKKGKYYFKSGKLAGNDG